MPTACMIRWQGALLGPSYAQADIESRLAKGGRALHRGVRRRRDRADRDLACRR